VEHNVATFTQSAGGGTTVDVECVELQDMDQPAGGEFSRLLDEEDASVDPAATQSTWCQIKVLLSSDFNFCS